METHPYGGALLTVGPQMAERRTPQLSGTPATITVAAIPPQFHESVSIPQMMPGGSIAATAVIVLEDTVQLLFLWRVHGRGFLALQLPSAGEVSAEYQQSASAPGEWTRAASKVARPSRPLANLRSVSIQSVI